MRRTALQLSVGAALLLPLSGCAGVQSVLDPAGVEAEQVETLYWVMTIGAGIILAAVIALGAAAIFGGERLRRLLSRETFIVGGGLVFPTVTLAGLLTYGLVTFAARGAATAPQDAFATITGELWWWRVTYHLPDGSRVESANELRVPVGAPVALALETADVIHSFWVPSLAGKLDMIPGRTNVLTLTATKPGISRGQCAEYCGGAHAFMGLNVIAMPTEEFQVWLQAEAAPAPAPSASDMQKGAQIFIDTGCGACHTIRGTAADGTIGPNLTHVGSRRSIGAATLSTSPEAFAHWIENNQHIKPENRMPPFGILQDTELALLAHYLDSLE
jgi:cytochrome c oxidase subunit 2